MSITNLIEKYKPSIILTKINPITTQFFSETNNNDVIINFQGIGSGNTSEESINNAIKNIQDEITIAINKVTAYDFQFSCDCVIDENSYDIDHRKLIYIFSNKCTGSSFHIFNIVINQIKSYNYLEGLEKSKNELLNQLNLLKLDFTTTI